MPLDAWMALCLHHEREGYYRARDPFAREERGGRADFATAPEVSQALGEIAGLRLLRAWRGQGRPAPFVLAELGPGRGLLLADAWRAAAAADPGFAAAARPTTVEANDRLAEACAARLAAADPPCPAVRLRDAGALPDGPLLLLANEFLDAMPARQHVADAHGAWRERGVRLDGAGRLAFCLTAARRPLPAAEAAPPGLVRESSPAAEAVVALVADQVAREGGAALLVDYGHEEPPGRSTLSAVAGGRRVDPLEAPGRSDLSTAVDFAAMRRAAGEAAARAGRPLEARVERLGRFLADHGLEERAARLGASDADAGARARRLAAPEGFGGFLVLSLEPPSEGGAPPA